MSSTINVTERTPSGSPEERIIREMYRTNKGGMAPKHNPVEFGRLIEDLVTRELTLLASQYGRQDIRFARGWIVDDYGSKKFEGASAKNAKQVTTIDPPRLDIICYRGDIAWRSFEGIPHALVPKSFAQGFLEVKRTLNPKRLHKGISKNAESVNDQLERQQEYMDSIRASVPQILVGAHYWDGSEMQVRNEANADSVALLGSLTRNGSASGMANDGELEATLKAFLSEL